MAPHSGEDIVHQTALPEDMTDGAFDGSHAIVDVPPVSGSAAVPGLRRGTLASVALAAAAVGLLVAGVVLGVLGYRAYIMQTPSMGTSAPVGSLVVTQPCSLAHLRQGDVVTVKPRQGGTTHTHRVVELSGDTAVTRGDLNGSADPERVGNGNLAGRAVAILPAVGWLVKMLPLVAVAMLAVFAVTVRVRDRGERFRYRAVGFFCALALSTAVVHPLLGLQLLSMRLDENADGPYAVAHVVSTGLLPVQVSPTGGHGHESELLAPTGAAGEALSTKPSAAGEFTFYPRLVLTPLWWGGVVLYCGLPFLVLGLYELTAGSRREPTA